MQNTTPRNTSFFSLLYLGISLLFFIGSFSNCHADMSKFEPRVNAFGRANHLVVIADEDLWKGAVGDTFKYYFSSAYLILPQPEPIFDLQHWTAYEITSEPIRQKKRNYLILGNLADMDSPTTKIIAKDLGEENLHRAQSDKNFNSTIGKNKWAEGQNLFYLFGNSKEELIENIKDKFPAIAKKINEADEELIAATVYAGGDHIEVMETVKEKLGVDIRIPHDYFLAFDDGSTIWLRKETDFLSSNIILHRLKYTDKSQLTGAGIKAIRDSLGKKLISTEIENTYMRTNDQDLPMVTRVISLNGNYALEARGIWDIVNDFMGGPFISYIIHKPDTDELLFVDGFVHAPGKKKRDYMQQLEYIFRSIKF